MLSGHAFLTTVCIAEAELATTIKCISRHPKLMIDRHGGLSPATHDQVRSVSNMNANRTKLESICKLQITLKCI